MANQKDQQRKEAIKKALLEEHPEFVGVGDEEMKMKMKKLLHAKIKKRRRRLMSHLEFFSDAVVAIIITIMVLEIPTPDHETTYGQFINAIIVFLVSFFIIANFWYEHHQAFDDVEEIDEKIMIADFIFLASLSILPMMTKWMMVDPEEIAVLNYGIVYLVVTFVLNLINYFIYRKKNHGDSPTKKVFRKFFIIRLVVSTVLTLILIVLSMIIPNQTMILYLLLPISSFLLNLFHKDKHMYENMILF